MQCPRCQQDNPVPDAQFCPRCGAPVKQTEETSPSAASYADLRRALSEASEQQAATAQILRVISSSPTDLQPVLKAVAESAARLCEARDAIILLRNGEQLLPHAHFGPISHAASVPIVRGSVSGRAALECRTIHVHDLVAVENEAEFPVGRGLALQDRFRTTLATPLLREGVALGVILIRRAEVRPFSDGHISLLQTFADQAVIAIENVRLFKELEARNSELRVALEQQTATSDLLKVIGRSTFDLQPVFETLVENAARLCEATRAVILRFDGQLLRFAVGHNVSPELREFFEQHPIAPGRQTNSGRAALERRTVHNHDVQSDPEYSYGGSQVDPYRTVLAVPMVRADELLGVILVYRHEVRPFTDNQVALMETFADQAVIAIENVRLFTELQEKNRALTEAHAQVTEALEQQTATSDILRVISTSPTDLQPVLDAIAQSAARLCEAFDAVVYRVDGDALRPVAHHGSFAVGPIPLVPGTLGGRSVIERRLVHVADVQAEVDEFPEGAAIAQREGTRSFVSVPLLREGGAIGTIGVRRFEIRPFGEKQIALLQTFADQAVIAIENVRLFKELEEKNLALTEAHANVTEALERQTATSEILRVISSSPTDVQPVFETIAGNALRLCEATFSAVFRYDGELIHLAALRNVTPKGAAAIRDMYPMPPGRGGAAARSILSRSIAHIADILQDPEYAHRSVGEAAEFRSILSVPMLREGQPIGAITVAGPAPRPFPDKQVELLRIFADQAVIAIENVRLFKELETRTAELTRSVGELKALGEVGRAVSSTLDLQAVLDTIVTRASKLSGTHGGVIYEYDEATEKFHLRAAHRLEDELVEALRLEPLRLGEGATGQAAATRAPFQVTNLLDEKEYSLTRIRPILARLGYRSILAVPLIFEERTLGALVVHRPETGAFAPEVVNLLQTFAAQSALAIQNARLFRELADKSRQLEAASRHKSEFLANMSHELRTPLNAIIGFSEVLLERMFGEVNDKQTEYLQDILASGQHLLSLINDILDLSKIEAGRMELALAVFHLPQALGNAVTLVKERAARHGIALKLEVDPGLGELVGDERKIKQVVLNLLSNAVKFTPEGGRISLTAGLRDGSAEISVSDTGIGIAPEDQGAIFEEFRQVGRDDARKQEGTGLGLTLTKKFVEMHGGRIWVESGVGRGSTFTFTLPIRP